MRTGHGLSVRTAWLAVACALGIAVIFVPFALSSTPEIGEYTEVEVGTDTVADLYLVPGADDDEYPILIRSTSDDGTRLSAHRVDTFGAVSKAFGELFLPSALRGDFHAAVDAAGQIWMASGEGLGSLDPRTGRFALRKLPRPSAGVVPAPQDPAVQSPYLDYVDLAADPAGHLWLAREFESVLWRVDARSGEATAVSGPAGRTTTGLDIDEDGLVVEVFDAATGATQVLRRDESGESWHEAATGRLVPGVGSANAHAFDPERLVVTSVPRSTDRRLPQTQAQLPGVVAEQGDGAPLAVGLDGDIWMLAGDRLLLRSGVTGRDVEYRIPTFSRNGRSVAPQPTSAIVDHKGDLWLAFRAGFSHVIVAHRQ